MLAYRELDEAFALTTMADEVLTDVRAGSKLQHSLTALLRQSIYSRLLGHDDINDAERLSVDPVMRQEVGGRAVDHRAASTNQMARFETKGITQPPNLSALIDLPGKWIDWVRQIKPIKTLILNLDRSLSETCGQQEGSQYNEHFGCECYHPLFCFNQDSDVEGAMLRNGNVASAHDWPVVPAPVIERYRDLDIRKLFRSDAAFAIVDLYEFLEAEGFTYVIGLPANAVLNRGIDHLMKHPVGRPPARSIVYLHHFHYQAGSWNKLRIVVVKVQWHRDELFARIGFVVTNMRGGANPVIDIYNRRGTAEQWIKEGKFALKTTEEVSLVCALMACWLRQARPISPSKVAATKYHRRGSSATVMSNLSPAPESLAMRKTRSPSEPTNSPYPRSRRRSGAIHLVNRPCTPASGMVG